MAPSKLTASGPSNLRFATLKSCIPRLYYYDFHVRNVKKLNPVLVFHFCDLEREPWVANSIFAIWNGSHG